jgi:hypothetical protein
MKKSTCCTGAFLKLTNLTFKKNVIKNYCYKYTTRSRFLQVRCNKRPFDVITLIFRNKREN